ncbi:MAG: YdaU family protein [Bacteroidota bacterium]
MNFYPFHIGDYISHTSHLSDEEDLAYRRMIDLYYLNEAPFDPELGVIARKIKSDPDVVDVILNEFFVFEDDKWHNKRADIEIAKYQFIKESGKKGAEKRWANRDEKPSQSISNSPPNATPIATKTNTNTKTKTKVNTMPTPDGVSVDLWDDFLVYRKRLKAPVTDRVLARLVKEADLAKMPLADVLETIIFKGWRSFEASWIQQAQQKAKELPLGTDQQIEEAYRVECGGDPRLARFGSYFEMKKFILDKREQRARA